MTWFVVLASLLQFLVSEYFCTQSNRYSRLDYRCKQTETTVVEQRFDTSSNSKACSANLPWTFSSLKDYEKGSVVECVKRAKRDEVTCREHHTSSDPKVHALMSHSLWPSLRTSSSIHNPAVSIRKIMPSDILFKPDMSWATGVLPFAWSNMYTAFSTILSGSFVLYGPCCDGGGVVLLVDCDAYDDSE